MPAAFALWICCCVYLSCAGWLLSAIHQLTPAGYVVALLPGIFAALAWFKKNARSVLLRKLCRRFHRPLPAIFLFLTALIFLGGLLYAPTNYDALTYRLPRMLNWLAAGTWHWIPTINDRMNWANTGWEWIALPLLALTHSDRALFLINALGFLLMPGLLFAIFRQLGVARKVAWTWMWILPLAYGYATQAGSIGNDLTGTIFCLLSLFFGLRARRSGRVADIWLALLAAALLTGVKISNAPLVLPVLVAVWPVLGRLRKRGLATLMVAIIAVLVSALPTMFFNHRYAGNWAGDAGNKTRMQVESPGAALLGNGLLLMEQAFMPPVLPGAGKMNDWINRQLPDSWANLLKQQFPRFYLNKLNELPTEEGAGLGLGVTLMLLAGVVVTVCGCGGNRLGKRVFFRHPPVMFAVWVAVLVYLLKVGSEAGPRLLLPYYPLLLVFFLLLPSQHYLLKFRAWRVGMMLVALSVLPALFLSAARPLWPGQAWCAEWLSRNPSQPVLQRMELVYSTYSHRNDLLAPLRAQLPANVRELGFIAGPNDTDYSLWRPFGHRQVIYPRHNISRFLLTPDVEWVVVKENVWPEISSVPLTEWVQQHHGQIVATIPIVELVSWGAENWCLLSLGGTTNLVAAPRRLP